MTLLPDEPLWLLDDAGQHTAHATVMEAMEWLQAEHPTFTNWRMLPQFGNERQIWSTDMHTNSEHGWTVRRA